MEERKVWCDACTTATRADGRRLFRYSKNTTESMASPSSNHTRLLSVRMRTSLCRFLRHPAKICKIVAKLDTRSAMEESRRLLALYRMLYSAPKMPVVFIVSGEWDLRGAVRAELREAGMEGLGMETVEDMARAIAGGNGPPLVGGDGA